MLITCPAAWPSTHGATGPVRTLVDVPDKLPVVVAIHTAPGRRLPMTSRDAVVAEAGKGLVGDRYHGARHRHVTIQSAPLLAEAGEALGVEVTPAGTRRNITVSHGAVPTAPGTTCRIGDVELEVVRVAAPCRILDDEIAPGAAAALRRRAGTCFRVLRGGEIRVGDAVRWGEEPARP